MTNKLLVPSLRTLGRPAGLRIGRAMTENLAGDGAVPDALFAVHAEPPWLLHLSGELDLCSARALSAALDGPTKRGGTVGLDLANLTYMDSTGIHVILNAASLLGDRGRVVMYSPSPIVRRLIDICGLDGMIDINDDPAPPGLTGQRSSPADDSSLTR